MLITLCGSARFEPWFHAWSEALGLSGHMVLGLVAYPSQKGGKKSWYTEDQKRKLDALHKEKIAASDAVLFLNVFGYMGESTLDELRFTRIHARKDEARLYSLESWGKGCGIHRDTHFRHVCEHAEHFGVGSDYASPVDMSYGGSLGMRGPYDLLLPAGEERWAIVDQLALLDRPTRCDQLRWAPHKRDGDGSRRLHLCERDENALPFCKWEPARDSFNPDDTCKRCRELAPPCHPDPRAAVSDPAGTVQP